MLTSGAAKQGQGWEYADVGERLRALNKRVAVEVMGWRWWTRERGFSRWLGPADEGARMNRDEEAMPRKCAQGAVVAYDPAVRGPDMEEEPLESPPWSSSPLHVVDVLVEIARRGLQDQLMLALFEVLDYPAQPNPWRLVTATPEERCTAALRAVERGQPVQATAGDAEARP